MMNFDVDLVKSFILAEDWEMAVALLESVISDNPENINGYWYLGIIYLLKGQEDVAEELWMSIFLQSTEENLDFLKNALINALELVLWDILAQQKLISASILLKSLYQLNENYDNFLSDQKINQCLHNILITAISLAQNQQFREAESQFKEILKFSPDFSLAWYNLAIMYYQINQYQLALKSIKNALIIETENANYLFLFGVILESNNNLQDAIVIYQKVISVNINFIDAYVNLGNCYQKLGYLNEAESTYRHLILIASNHCGGYINLGRLLLQQKRYSESLLVYQQAIVKVEPSPELYENWVEVLQNLGQMSEAIAIGEQGIKLFPNDWVLQRKVKLLLPILYDSVEEIDWYRHRYELGLDNLLNLLALKSFDSNSFNIRGNTWKDQTSITNFYLSYQGKNDLFCQIKYNYLITQLMELNQLSPLGFQGRLSENSLVSRPKIGYVSAYFRHHTVGKLMLGWLKYRDPKKCEIYCYYLHPYPEEPDSYTKQYQCYSDHFFHFWNLSFEEICEKIIQEKIDILVFLDVGMTPISVQLASLRLAPIQCVTWGHPITTGSPTIDYFLSSELMEPENGNEHYSETLIRLPNIGIAYQQPNLSDIQANRQHFNFQENDILYLSCQSLFKYLPQYDYLFPEIAQRVKNARFVFLSSRNSENVTEQFCQRLGKAFSSYNLNWDDFCIVMPRLNQEEYLRLNLVSDIFLDTLSWSGGNTTLEAIACGLPVVTCPGEFMRGRHAYGILRMLGVTETIADNEEEYIEIAVRLGKDQVWRRHICSKVTNSHKNLYEDRQCVKKLELFYHQAIRDHIANNNTSL